MTQRIILTIFCFFVFNLNAQIVEYPDSLLGWRYAGNYYGNHSAVFDLFFKNMNNDTIVIPSIGYDGHSYAESLPTNIKIPPNCYFTIRCGRSEIPEYFNDTNFTINFENIYNSRINDIYINGLRVEPGGGANSTIKLNYCRNNELRDSLFKSATINTKSIINDTGSSFYIISDSLILNYTSFNSFNRKGKYIVGLKFLLKNTNEYPVYIESLKVDDQIINYNLIQMVGWADIIKCDFESTNKKYNSKKITSTVKIQYRLPNGELHLFNRNINFKR